MKATSIPRYEQTFVDTGIDALGKKFKLKAANVPVPNNGNLRIIDCVRENGDDSFYFKEPTPKQRIVLHFTAGYLKGDIGTLTTPQNHVSVPYVIARSGDIFRLFDDAHWSYHLGPGASGGNSEMSKQSVAIEISNIGWLEKVGSNLASSYSKTDVYCSLDETAYYTKLAAPYRGQTYFATFTAAQYESLSKLLQLLLSKYPNVQRSFLPEPDRYAYLQNPAVHKCIMSHVNFRDSGKWDLGPAFEWNKVVL